MLWVLLFQYFYNNKDITDWPNEKPVWVAICLSSIGMFDILSTSSVFGRLGYGYLSVSEEISIHLA